MSAPKGIDWEWAITTGGTLSARQRRQLTGTLISALPRMLTGQVKLALGRRGPGRVDFTDLRLPDSKLAKAAETEARECLTPHVLEHSYRSYFFGRALSELDGVPYDDELAYVSCLLHDLNLEHPTPGRCFAVTGAERAMDFALASGATQDQADIIGKAIAAHLTVGVADDLGDLGFVSAGAAVDVFGGRMWDLDPAWVTDLLARHPRYDFKRHMTAAVTTEAAAVPHGRGHWLMTTAAFRQLIRMAPFPE
ncbi:phosphohydrolase [Nocardia huaxiensis]|uniref:Phosphohydrolase n=2 Tax=Nocardia huaxiensis TaxID=2755382 RepID=A0A7D6VEV7_9NOCA|nr:phosphohydrolase [Nocardia huaxiensis]QLY33834.1 phosphohydrolase [Nocardia huaxiensis]UFS99239.1 phosphohydrolase [Nocardia huaxiensis]